jgi:hypothetical protein
MVTVFEECTTEEQRYIVFWGQKDSMQRIFRKKYFLFIVGSVCPVQRFAAGLRNCHLGGIRFADDEEVEPEVRKWLKQKSKDFYAAGLEALVKRWDKCINVGEHVEK